MAMSISRRDFAKESLSTAEAAAAGLVSVAGDTERAKVYFTKDLSTDPGVGNDQYDLINA